MKTTVYLVRHSEPFKNHKGIENTFDGLLLSNIMTPLSIDGEKLADMVSENQEFKNLDVVRSSDYVRTMSTAKYFAFKNNLKVNIDEKFNERIHGINYQTILKFINSRMKIIKLVMENLKKK